ncbi:hypothetical protein FQZ97_923250 [compost metagenome]
MGDQVPSTAATPKSMAAPMEPMSGLESKVEQTLYCRMGAPKALRLAKAVGRCSRIQAGLRPREVPASPMQRMWEKRAIHSTVGVCRKSTVGTPARVKASITSVEPVKSSP